MTEKELMDKLVEIKRNAYDGKQVIELVDDLLIERWGQG